MPDTAPSSAPNSLSEIIQAVQATSQAASQTAQAAQAEPPAAPSPDSTPAATPSGAPQVTDTTPPAGTAATGDAQTQTTDAGDGAAAKPDGDGSTTTTPPPPQIDWGAAMPSLKAMAAELFPGEDLGWLNSQADIKALLKHAAGREKQVGVQSHAVGALNTLAQANVTIPHLQALMELTRRGVTAEQLRAALQAAGQAGAGGNGQTAGPVAWSRKFLAGRDGEGKPIFNRAELARAGLSEAEAAQRYAAWQDQLADIFSGPEGIQDFIAGVVDPRLGQVTQEVTEQTRQELTAAQQAMLQRDQIEQAQREYAAATKRWCDENAKILYLNEKEIGGGVKPFFNQMSEMMTRLGIGANPSIEQLTAVRDMCLAVNRPVPAPQTPSAKANRQPPTGAKPGTLSSKEFAEKYGDRFAGPLGILEYAEYVTSGKIPEKPAAA